MYCGERKQFHQRRTFCTFLSLFVVWNKVACIIRHLCESNFVFCTEQISHLEWWLYKRGSIVSLKIRQTWTRLLVMTDPSDHRLPAPGCSFRNLLEAKCPGHSPKASDKQRETRHRCLSIATTAWPSTTQNTQNDLVQRTVSLSDVHSLTCRPMWRDKCSHIVLRCLFKTLKAVDQFYRKSSRSWTKVAFHFNLFYCRDPQVSSNQITSWSSTDPIHVSCLKMSVGKLQNPERLYFVGHLFSPLTWEFDQSSQCLNGDFDTNQSFVAGGWMHLARLLWKVLHSSTSEAQFHAIRRWQYAHQTTAHSRQSVKPDPTCSGAAGPRQTAGALPIMRNHSGQKFRGVLDKVERRLSARPNPRVDRLWPEMQRWWSWCRTSFPFLNTWSCPAENQRTIIMKEASANMHIVFIFGNSNCLLLANLILVTCPFERKTTHGPQSEFM